MNIHPLIQQIFIEFLWCSVAVLVTGTWWQIIKADVAEMETDYKQVNMEVIVYYIATDSAKNYEEK